MDRKFWLSLVLTAAGAMSVVFVAMLLIPSVQEYLSDGRQWMAAFALWGVFFGTTASFMKANDKVIAAVGRTPTRDDIVVKLADHHH